MVSGLMIHVAHNKLLQDSLYIYIHMALLSKAGGVGGGAYTVPSAGPLCSKTRRTKAGSGGVDVLRMKDSSYYYYCSRRSLSTKSSVLNHSVSKRGNQLIVAASPPPTDEAVVATEPLSREDLIAYLASGCKSKDKWRIGTEHEKFGFEVNTLRPMKYDQIAELLNSIAERFEWEKVMEGDKIIGLKQGKQSIS